MTQESGRWPAEPVVKLVPGDVAALSFPGMSPSARWYWLTRDGQEVELPLEAITTAGGEPAYRLTAEQTRHLASLDVVRVAVRHGEATVTAGRVWWGDRWQGVCTHGGHP